MSARAARTALAVLVVALLLATVSLDMGRLSRGIFWSDASTYHAMAWSLAEDQDLRYEARDLARIRREFPLGPQGILLKRASGGLRLVGEFPFVARVDPGAPAFYYAKAFVYPLVAAPFVRLLGTRGLLLVNGLALGLALVLGYGEMSRQAGPGRALAVVLVLFLGTVAPVYLLWMTPELFNLGLITAGLVAWRRGRPLLAAVLLGIAAYSKPPSVFLALPLGLEPLASGGRLGPRLRESLRRGGLVAAVAVGLFGLNALWTGEWNYQGGERKAFEGRYPLETPDVTFDNSGTWMTTEHLGPLVRGPDATGDRSGAALTSAEIRGAFVANLGYFVLGRFGGALPYYFPAVLGAGVFLLAGPRTRAGWLALAALAVSAVFYIWLIPANWYGGGGAVGNRYFVNLLPLGLFLVPRGREGLVAAVGLLGALVFVGGLLLSPLEASRHPGAHAVREPFLHLPLELSELNDLSIFMEAWRKKRPFGDTEGRGGSRAEKDAYYLYFPDDGTWGKETAFGTEGFWVRRGSEAEVVVRALEPVREITLTLHGGAAASTLRVRRGAESVSVEVPPGGEGRARLGAGSGFPYYGTYIYVLSFWSEGLPVGEDRQAFVRLGLAVEPRR